MNGNYSIGRTGVLSFGSAGIKGIMRLSRKSSMFLPSAGAKPAALFSPPENPQGLRGQSQKYAYLRPARQMNNHYPAVSKVKAARRGRKSSPVSGSKPETGLREGTKGGGSFAAGSRPPGRAEGSAGAGAFCACQRAAPLLCPRCGRPFGTAASFAPPPLSVSGLKPRIYKKSAPIKQDKIDKTAPLLCCTIELLKHAACRQR